jgi:hypothetical protein
MHNPDASRRGNADTRHCEERKRRSNPAYFEQTKRKLDCFAALAMTVLAV